MARIPRLLARRARSIASMDRGVPSGSEWACMSIAPINVCAAAGKAAASNIANIVRIVLRLYFRLCLRELVHIRKLRADEVGFLALRHNLQVLAQKVRGGGEFLLLSENHSQDVAGPRIPVGGVQFDGLAQALLGGIQ